MLHPHDRNVGRARLVDDGADIRDDRVALVRLAHNAVLDVDHEQCGVRTVFECRHGSPWSHSVVTLTLAGRT